MNSDLTIEAMIRLAVVIQVVCLGFLILWGLVHLQATRQEEMNIGGNPVLIPDSSDIWLHADESPLNFNTFRFSGTGQSYIPCHWKSGNDIDSLVSFLKLNY
ncbi:MAG: hypothetical protein LR011_13500 [Verrucomicrobia bacterium]|nr:hypothetical protein [Verrucomicrobiota bacterium]